MLINVYRLKHDTHIENDSKPVINNFLGGPIAFVTLIIFCICKTRKIKKKKTMIGGTKRSLIMVQVVWLLLRELVKGNVFGGGSETVVWVTKEYNFKY